MYVSVQRCNNTTYVTVEAHSRGDICSTQNKAHQQPLNKLSQYWQPETTSLLPLVNKVKNINCLGIKSGHNNNNYYYYEGHLYSTSSQRPQMCLSKYNPQVPLPAGDPVLHLINVFCEHTVFEIPNSILIGSLFSVGLTRDQQTDRDTHTHRQCYMYYFIFIIFFKPR